jgi:amino acid transporter
MILVTVGGAVFVFVFVLLLMVLIMVLMTMIIGSSLAQTTLVMMVMVLVLMILMILLLLTTMIMMMMVPITRIGHRDQCQAHQAQELDQSRHAGGAGSAGGPCRLCFVFGRRHCRRHCRLEGWWKVGGGVVK